jgi:hypothetical protein
MGRVGRASPVATSKRRKTLRTNSWDGTLYDCDFNQMLGLSLGQASPRHIRDFNPAALQTRRIVTANHCYGCTAGVGSSCGGAVT